jgi:hypothetical protein
LANGQEVQSIKQLTTNDLPALSNDNEENLHVEDYKSIISQKYKQIEQEIGYYNEQNQTENG